MTNEERFRCPECGTKLVPTCFYCGATTEDTPIAVESHIMRCDKHPIRSVYKQLREAREALAATSGPTDMRKLEEWLEEKQQHYAKLSRDYLAGRLQTGFSYGEREEAIKGALDHIRTEFLGEEK